MFIDPETPVYNTIVFYIMIVISLLIIRPKFMYDEENKIFKSFGNNENQTLLSFPLVSIGSGILLYLLFLVISLLYFILTK